MFIVKNDNGATEQIEVTIITATGVATITNVQFLGDSEVMVQPVPLPIVEI